MSMPDPVLLIAVASKPQREWFADNFVCDGYTVYRACRSDTASRVIAQTAVNAVVIGALEEPAAQLRFLRTLRAERPRLPLIALAQGHAELDRIRPIEAGANSVAPAECSYMEARAHVRAQLNQPGRPDSRSVLRAGPLEVMPGSRRVTFMGDEIEPLSPMEFSLLSVMATDPERVFTKAELLETVWGIAGASGVSTRTLDSHACRLRRKLQRSDGPRLLQNVWGVGYRLLDPTRLAAAA